MEAGMTYFQFKSILKMVLKIVDKSDSKKEIKAQLLEIKKKKNKDSD
jgi:hypothetical protein